MGTFWVNNSISIALGTSAEGIEEEAEPWEPKLEAPWKIEGKIKRVKRAR